MGNVDSNVTDFENTKTFSAKTRTGELWDATKLLTGHRCGKRNFACSHTAKRKNGITLDRVVQSSGSRLELR
jgi:hypothetical protein